MKEAVAEQCESMNLCSEKKGHLISLFSSVILNAGQTGMSSL